MKGKKSITAHKQNQLQQTTKLQYSNSWEDAELLLQTLPIQEGARILSIASAGDSSFSLLTQSPQEILTIDMNDAQLFLVEIKKMAIKHLSYEETLEFLGFWPCETRLKYYQYLKGWLSFDAQIYWDKHQDMLRKGVISQGKFEQYFSFFAKRILPMIHSKELIRQMFVEKSSEEQQYFYMQHWNSLKWRLLFKLFFNKYALGKFGKNIDFRKTIQIPIEDYIFQQAERFLSSKQTAHNPFLRFALTGNFGQELPHYVKAENFRVIQKNIDRIHLQKGHVSEIIPKEKPFSYFNLSSVIENVPHKNFEKLAYLFAKHSYKRARFAYWNFLPQRRFSKVHPQEFQFQGRISTELGSKDSSFFIVA